MKPTHFRGRKNARRINAVEAIQHRINEAHALQNKALEGRKFPSGSPEKAQALADALYLEGKIQRLTRDLENTQKKIMEQGAAEAVRTKKNRQEQRRFKSA